MRLLLALLGSTPVLDEDTADRLLSGRLGPGDTPSGYVRVARVLQATSGPATPEELAGEAAAIAAFEAVVHAHSPTAVPRRAPMPSRLFSIKAAAAVIAAVLAIGGVAAAATGRLPGRSQQAAHHASTASQAGSSAHVQGGNGGSGANGPDATGSAKNGLCQAWQSGQGGTNGKRMDSTAFQALATAAGGADKVAAYCQAVLAAKGASHATANGPDATGATKEALCKAWQSRESGQAASHGRWEDSPAYKALVTAAGGADKVAAWCQTATTAAGQDHGQGQEQRSSGGSSSPNGHGQGGPPTTG